MERWASGGGSIQAEPALVLAKGGIPELFVCGLHVDRFIRTLPPAELRQFLQQGISIRADGDSL